MSLTRSLAEILSTVSPSSESAAYCGMDDRFGVDTAATLGLVAQLFVADHRQHRPQVLVVRDGAWSTWRSVAAASLVDLDPIWRRGRAA